MLRGAGVGFVPGCLADLVITAARIHTSDPALPSAESMAVRRGQVVALGTAAETSACVGPRTRVESRPTATILPGFIDGHSHPVAGGIERGLADLYDAETLEDAIGSTRAWADAHAGAPWIEGSGWDPVAMAGVSPRAALDAAFPARPVFLASSDGHSAWVNTAAFAAAGVALDAPDPRGGAIHRDAAGAPTGVVTEMAVDAFAEALPEPSRAAVDAGLHVARGEWTAAGITTVVDADASEEALAAYARADRRGALSTRVFAAVSVAPGEGAAGVRRAARWGAKHGTPRVRVHAVKLFLDGVIEAKTAALVEPYADGTRADLQFTDAELDAIASEAGRRGLALHAHAIGDAAVRQFVALVERHRQLHGSVAAHVQLVAEGDAERLARAGVAVAASPLWAYPDATITELTEPVIGPERTARSYPLATLLRAGVAVAGSSDWPVTTMDPWDAIEVAVTRRDPALGADAPALGPEEAISLDAALAMYTRDGARALGREDVGVLREGARADFVVVDRDPAALAPTELDGVQVVETWVGGVIARP